VARYLGPHDFGILSYAQAFIAFFAFFSHLGFNQILVRELTKFPEKSAALLGSTFVMKLMGAVVSVALIGIVISLLKSDDIVLKSVVMILSVIYILQAFDVIDFFYQAKVLSKYVVIARNCAFILGLLLKVGFILGNAGLVWFAAAGLAEAAVAAGLLLLIFVRSGYRSPQWCFDRTLAVDMLRYSWPLAISAFLIMIHLKIDQVMIDHYLGMNDVGVYSVAVKLAEFWYFLPAIVVSTLMPYFVELRERDYGFYQARLIQLYSLMFWSGAAVGTIVYFLGEFIIRLLYGEAYAGAYAALVINIWAGIFVAQSQVKGIWTISENLQIYRIVNNSVAIVVNVALNTVLIPKYGISGAAMATLASRFVNNYITPLMFKPIRANALMAIKSINPVYSFLATRR
jgi:O-antigen/teichoic acid export membrane protein